MRRFTLLLGLAILVALGSDKALTGTAGNIGGGDRWQFRLRLSAPEPSIQKAPGHPELGRVLSIPTFGLSQSGEGRAAAGREVPLPVKVVRVAIPDGAEVSLEPIRASRKLLKGLRLGPVDESGRGRTDSEAGPTAAPATGETRAGSARNGSAPSPIRLGQVGYLRFQRFVEVIYTPVARPSGDAATSAAAFAAGEPIDLEFYPDVEADLVVTGVDASLISAKPAPPSDDPYFEQSYRSAFVNYEEGRRFRLKDRVTPEISTALIAQSPAAVSPFAAATTPVYRVVAVSRGIYRLTWSYLLDPSTGVAPGLSGAAPSTFKLMNKGVEVPIRVIDGGDGNFGPGDFIEFYGEGILDEPKLVLNYHYDPNLQPGFADIDQANDVTDENVYFLFAEPGARSRTPGLSGAVQPFATVTSFSETAHRELDNRFVPDGVNDSFYQGPPLFENNGSVQPDPNAANCGYANPGINTAPARNWLGPVPASDPNHYCEACDLRLADPVNAAGTATLRVRLRGASHEQANPDHLTVVQLGSVASQSSASCWDDEAVVTQMLTVPQTALVGGAGVYIEQPGLLATASLEALFLDWIEVDYQRILRLNGNRMIAHYPTNDPRTYDMGGFPNSTSADMIVYDISRTIPASTVPSPRLVTGGTVSLNGGTFNYKFSLPADATLPAGAPRRFAAAGTGGFLTPVRVEGPTGEDLTSTTLSADMIVITTPDVVDMTAGSSFMSYLAHRQTDSGLAIKVVMMRDIYDSFSFGIETPEALRSFLAYAVDNWKGPSGNAAAPSYAMLVGDTSVDYKNLLGDPTWVNQVPTFIMYQPGPILDYYASDSYVAAFRGADQLPDIHLGRVAAHTHAESEAVFQKMLDYDVSPPAGSWRSRGVFIADKGHDQGETDLFQAEQSGVADTYYVAPFSNDKLYAADPNYLNGGALDPNLWRADFKNKEDAGAAFTSFFGHGNFFNWGLQTLLNQADVSTLLSPTRKPTFLVNENCLAGGFHARSLDSLGEAFQKAPDKGAIAVFAPSGLSFAVVGHTINDAVDADLFGLSKERRFGNMITDVRLALSFSITDLQAYVLLGDPAQRFILPAPRPPVGFRAVTDLNARVDLSWSPGPDPNVLTRIYRRDAFFPTYTLLTPGGVAETSYADTSAINGKAYFYRAVSVDPSGPFEGGVTNFNSDCNYSSPRTSGPDCVWAIPINPNPPSIPADFRVINPGVGDRLQVGWSAASEPDISNYTLRYGTSAGGPYPNSLNIQAPAAGGLVTGLVSGTTYYFVMTATNSSGKTSASTPEVSGMPFVFDGITPPGMINDLRLLRSGSQPASIELRWTPPAVDIYGSATTLASMSIYRGTSPYFIPSPANLIASVGPGVGTYTDPNAYVAASDYFYLVGAIDRNGYSSGLGLQLPLGIADLTVALSPPNLVLSWGRVSTDVDHAPTLVDHYVVYSDSQPVSRPRTDVLSPLAPSLVTTSFTTTIPPGSIVYYSVIVVDVRGNRSPY